MQAASPLPAGTRWWILCRVVDNFGDAGVCWRLARQLVREHDAEVTLFIDRPELIARLAGTAPPRLAGGPQARLAGVRVEPWPASPVDAQPEVVLCAFGCEPPGWIRSMLAGGPRRPLWIHLEYLSAEPWVDGCHGLSSVKPDGAVEHFYYPGFTPASGGLLRERDALAPAERPAEAARAAALERLCGQSPEPGERVITLFCYPDSPLDALLPALARGVRPTLLLVPEGVAPDEPEAFAGCGLPPGGPAARRGRLRIARIRFLPQDDYDALLRLADLNFVRGEDSWIRAHWARRPFVWQPYRQDEDTHHDKLEAFLGRLRAAAAAAGDPPAAIGAVEATMRAWSGLGDADLAWQALAGQDEAIEGVFRHWAETLARQPDLAAQLAGFVRDRL
ncbi:elongation factor P maturation arginine rhamnosyltransferase EarP [Zeimonas arvi]|uniref:Protein-arginine rhamnosyltransferase n=1 Tax=Zeimonas arvi TaxID=2498847 RepID=A0A5C8NYP6_9BURK|nr:elongation factor P maturation arginine rhamnosyltransferase EarP [Zeimonas arvi]TXL66266.1 elongation factor P maturation arginine rhamnosyltransferase EarP [Zeimonas arvi]